MKKNELKQLIKEVLSEITNSEYDFSFAKENVIGEYKYKGFNIKIASINSARFGELYYGISDYGEPHISAPSTYNSIEKAKAAIEKWIDSN